MAIMKAIFENAVIYEPATHSFYKIENEEDRTTIAIPASLCLLSLLEHRDKIVSHDMLLEYVWESRGMRVSPNTVYQNISLLRKFLADQGLSTEFIKTAPKRGFFISKNININLFYDETSSNDKSKNLSQELNKPIYSKNKSSHKNIIYYIIISCISIIVFCFSYMKTFTVSSSSIPKYTIPKYQELERLDNCRIFRNASLRDDSFFYRIIKNYKLECKNEKWWYFNNAPPDHEVSLFRCSDKFDINAKAGSLSCVSDFYIDGDK